MKPEDESLDGAREDEEPTAGIEPGDEERAGEELTDEQLEDAAGGALLLKRGALQVRENASLTAMGEPSTLDPSAVRSPLRERLTRRSGGDIRLDPGRGG